MVKKYAGGDPSEIPVCKRPGGVYETTKGQQNDQTCKSQNDTFVSMDVDPHQRVAMLVLQLFEQVTQRSLTRINT